MNIENSRSYYGDILTSSDDLKTDACSTADAPSPAVRAALANVHAEVKSRYYGCGLVAPQAIEGARILDLGSGSGQDAYLLAQRVGEKGSVVGVDTTPAQLEVANRHIDWHRERFGYAKSNVSFIEGDIEKLGDLGLESGSFDSSASRVPSSRVLAATLGISRPTVNQAFSKLLAVGYLLVRKGSGIFVADHLPATFLKAARLALM